jgi:hypothetical protein
VYELSAMGCMVRPQTVSSSDGDTVAALFLSLSLSTQKSIIIIKKKAVTVTSGCNGEIK